LIEWSNCIIGIVEIGVDDSETDCVMLEVLVNLFITFALLIFCGIRTFLKHYLYVTERLAVEVTL
jgi:hypothetical protein